jgi:hypothetical protein
VVTRLRRRLGHSLFTGAAGLALALGLIGCGPGQESAPVPETGEEVRPHASPESQQRPDLTNQASATIVEGALDPNRFSGEVGSAFQLFITGDGEEHTLEIEELVAATPVAAEGETAVGFTIVGEPGISQITLDGNPAGEFERTSASGVVTD